jgi:hypothetical protein
MTTVARPVRRRATDGPALGCDPPYTVDENGRVEYKRACFGR